MNNRRRYPKGGRGNSGRSRHNNGSNHSQYSLNKVYDSNGPSGKVRGTAQTIYEKYQSLARDAQASGDRVLAESFLQHAEHYLRIIHMVQEYIRNTYPTQEAAPQTDADEKKEQVKQTESEDKNTSSDNIKEDKENEPKTNVRRRSPIRRRNNTIKKEDTTTENSPSS